jgi:hypothetical protein
MKIEYILIEETKQPLKLAIIFEELFVPMELRKTMPDLGEYFHNMFKGLD